MTGSGGTSAGGTVQGDLRPPPWFAHQEASATSTFSGIARRLPMLIGQSLQLAWAAGRRDTLLAMILTVLAGVFTAVGLLSTVGVLTALFAAGPTPDRVLAALPALLVVAAAAIAKSLLSAGAGWAQSRLQPQVERLAQQRIYAMCVQVELKCYDDDTFHDALLRARDRGVMAAPSMVVETIDAVTGITGILAAAGTLGALHPILLPLLLLSTLPDGWAAIRSARLRYLVIYTLSTLRRRGWVLSDLMGDRPPAADVRSFHLGDFLLAEWDKVARIGQDAHLDLARRHARVRVTGDAARGLTTAGVYLALGVLLWLGAVPLAIAGAAVLAIRTGQTSLATLVYSINKIYEEGLYFTDYVDFAEQARRHLPRAAGRQLPPSFSTLTVNNVTFTYPGATTPALRQVSLTLRRGEIIALVGENGSGKTTLAKILAGLYDPDDGSIHYDDVPISDVSPDHLRDRISVISQDYARWPLSARLNITLGRDHGDHRFVAAAQASGADHVITGLPDGWDTLLDRRFKNGRELSGGQWQRIAVARGLYRPAPLLICDEPTAALDARAEHALFDTIGRHADGSRTVLLITHRLATVRHADRVYVLADGQIIEAGSPAELLQAGGLFAELYDLQASQYQPSKAHPQTREATA